MINLKKQNTSVKNIIFKTIILSFFIFTIYCISVVHEYDNLPRTVITYTINKDQVYAKYNDGKHKSWDLKALAKNNQNGKLYWINVTAADVYQGHTTRHGEVIIPAGKTYNTIILAIGLFSILIYITIFCLSIIFLPITLEFLNEYYKKVFK